MIRWLLTAIRREWAWFKLERRITHGNHEHP